MRKILVAYDGGAPAIRALQTAADMAHAFGAEVTVISVVRARPGRFPTDPWDSREVHANELVEARALLRERGVEATLIEPAGDPALEIERVAREQEFDTIIVGSRGLTELGRIMLGSVSEHVASHADATVIVAR